MLGLTASCSGVDTVVATLVGVAIGVFVAVAVVFGIAVAVAETVVAVAEIVVAVAETVVAVACEDGFVVLWEVGVLCTPPPLECVDFAMGVVLSNGGATANITFVPGAFV